MSWTLNNVSLATLGIERLRIVRSSRAGGTATFSAPAALLSTSPALADGLSITIRQGSTVRFVGTIRRHTVSHTGPSGMFDWSASDVWTDLGRVVYHQTRAAKDATGAAIADVTTTLVRLYQDRSGARIGAVDQILDILACAVARGISIQAGTISLQAPGVGSPPVPIPLTPPYETRQDITCMEAINAVLDWCPDAVSWIDYSTTPPSLHAKSASLCTASTLDLTANRPSELTVSPRPDMAIPGLRLIFEEEGSDGVVYTVQDAGTPSAIGALEQTIKLSHSPGVGGEFEDVLVKPAGDATLAAWWTPVFPWLANVSGLTLHDLDVSPPVTYPALQTNLLLSGKVQPWMKPSRIAEKCTVSIEADFYLDGIKFRNKPLSVPVIFTDLETKRYHGVPEFAWTEEVPVGLADCLYASMSILQYEGRIAFDDVDPDPRGIDIGARLNLSNGHSTWATMNAQVQSIDISVDDGKSVISFGPPGHLAPQDIMELLRANRRRSLMLQADNSRDDSDLTGDKAFPAGETPLENCLPEGPASEGGTVEKMVMTPDATPTKSVTIDSGALATGDAMAIKTLTLTPISGYPIVKKLLATDNLAFQEAQIISDWRLNKSTHSFEVKTITAYVLTSGTVSAWTAVTDANGGTLDVGVVP